MSEPTNSYELEIDRLREELKKSLNQNYINDYNMDQQKQGFIQLCEKALWGLQKCNPMREETPSQYNKGYQLGWKETQKLGINLIERVITELK